MYAARLIESKLKKLAELEKMALTEYSEEFREIFCLWWDLK